MLEALVVYMAVSVAPGSMEARPFLRLRNGEQCELFHPTCMVRGEIDYGRAKINELQNHTLDNMRKAYGTH